MMADDHALRALLPDEGRPPGDPPAWGTAVPHTPHRELAKALLRFGTAGTSCTPEGALTVLSSGTEGEITARVSRLLQPPPPLSRAARATVVLTASLLVTAVVLLLVIP
jgi:hypothetical protein